MCNCFRYDPTQAQFYASHEMVRIAILICKAHWKCRNINYYCIEGNFGSGKLWQIAG